MKNLNNPKAFALMSTALLVASLFWLLSTKRVNSSLESGWQNEKLKSEQLLSEKLQLEKEIQKFKDQLVSLRDRNTDLDNLVRNVNNELQKSEADFNRLRKENLSLVQIRKQRQELVDLQNKLQNELASLRAAYTAMESKNLDLSNTVAHLEARNKLLSDELNKAMFAAVDQSQIQALKGTDKLTVRARKTKKLVANFEIPSHLRNLSFRIIDSNGRALTSKDGTISSTVTPSDNSYTASSEAGVTGNRLQNVEMIFMPGAKLKGGIYTLEILNENLYVGSLKLKLK
jgi:myosin heavy subunit